MTGEPDDALLARYLMGVCSEDEKARIEEHLFAQDEVFERLCAVEEELIGRRLREELTREDRDQFDRAYAAPPRRDRVLFARALSSVLSEEASKEAEVSWWSAFWRTSGFPLAFAAASVVLVAGVTFLSWRASELRSSLASIQVENDTLRQQRDGDRQRLAELEKRAATLNDELNRERAGRPGGGEPRPSGLIATFVLSPGLLRSARVPARVVVRPATQDVRLQLDLEPGIDASRFRAELRNAESRVLWSQDGFRATPLDGGAAVVVTLPAALFEAGEYELILHGVSGREREEAGRYYFDVVKR